MSALVVGTIPRSRPPIAYFLAARVVAAALLFPASACQLVTEFELRPVEETTEALCADGRDNDFDGLSDCQDWTCLDKLPCCDIPEVLLVDDFDGPSCDDPVCSSATCASKPGELSACYPAAARWHTWPCPYPTVCDGALRIDKTTMCFPAGALSVASFGLDPGLRIEVDLLHAPERLGYLEIALTLQAPENLPGSIDPCGRAQTIEGFAGVRQVWAEQGYSLVAFFQGRALATSPPIATPGVPHRVALAIDATRRITYSIDGTTFATADVPVPETDVRARLALSGLTAKAAFDSVRIQAGLRCHSPTTWALRGGSPEAAVVLAGARGGGGPRFDDDEVYHPTLARAGNTLDLYYTGCFWTSPQGGCDPLVVGIGRATSTDGGETFTRASAEPLITPDDVPTGALSNLGYDMSVDAFDDRASSTSEVLGYVTLAKGSAIHAIDRQYKVVAARSLSLGAAGEWDSGEICCMSAVRLPDGTVHLWYAGRATSDKQDWRIGLATSTDEITFTKHPENPVFREGAPDGFDSAAVLNPTVVWDAERRLFRMWYEGRDFFGKARIGYAVSTDGVHWSRAPQNPVLSPEDFGLATIGGPEVLLETDGRLLLWLHGTTQDVSHRRIYFLTNGGALIE